MDSDTNRKHASKLNYATTFNELVLGLKCIVDVTVDIRTGEAAVVVSRQPRFVSTPSFRISLDDLKSLSESIRSAEERAKLLDDPINGATDHQLNCTCGWATLIVVKPPGSPARFTLTIGHFHREGPLTELSSREIDESIAKLEAILTSVLKKARK
jgi:hypothetical protein